MNGRGITMKLIQSLLRVLFFSLKFVIKMALVIVAITLIAGLVNSCSETGKQRELSAGPCANSWELCSDNSDLINKYKGVVDAQVACKRSAIDRGRYGEPSFPWLSFGRFLPGDDYPKTGIITLIELDARYANQFGAMVQTRVACRYDLAR